jgi:DNA/RNA endonuclease YhcR with UshA esterase domain
MTLPRGICVALLFALALAALAGAIPSRGVDDDKTKGKIIPSAEIRNHIGKECTAEMTVKSSKNAVPRRTYFLDSEEDFHDEKNLAVVISYDHAAKFQEAGIDDPAEYYKGKTIRVTGKVIEENDQVRIRVDDPKQIKLVEKKSP